VNPGGGDRRVGCNNQSQIFYAFLNTGYTRIKFYINLNDREIENFLEIPCQMLLPIKPFSPRKVAQEIKNINLHKAPVYDLITGKILR
jgi:hypothetical protein